MIEQRRIFKSSGLVPINVESAAAAMPRLDDKGGIDGAPVLVPLALITDSPFQTSPINQDKVDELIENLKQNPLSSPVVLRRGLMGRLELIAGRHRVEAYRRLDRSEIEATLRNLNDDDAEKLVFYDNLFAPSMSDFQRYMGFRQRRERLGLTLDQLADESGVSKSTISKLLSFDGLSAPVLEALRENPGAIGVAVAAEFVTLARSNADLAIQAIYQVALGEMTQKAAMAWIKAGGKKQEAAKPEQSKALIKSGKQKYAELVRRADKLVISLNAEDESIYDDLQAWLKSRAAQHFNTQAQEGERAAD